MNLSGDVEELAAGRRSCTAVWFSGRLMFEGLHSLVPSQVSPPWNSALLLMWSKCECVCESERVFSSFPNSGRKFPFGYFTDTSPWPLRASTDSSLKGAAIYVFQVLISVCGWGQLQAAWVLKTVELRGGWYTGLWGSLTAPQLDGTVTSQHKKNTCNHVLFCFTSNMMFCSDHVQLLQALEDGSHGGWRVGAAVAQ